MNSALHAQPIDRVSTLALPQHKGSENERYLSFLNRVLTRLLVLLSLVTLGQSSAYASSTYQQINNYKLYAHNRIFDAGQYECYQQLINRESQWDAKARNGSMYGLPQGHSRWLSTVDAYQQIDWSISYIVHRYAPIQNAYCRALAHSLRHGWY